MYTYIYCFPQIIPGHAINIKKENKNNIQEKKNKKKHSKWLIEKIEKNTNA